MFGALRTLWLPKPPATVAATYIALVAAARNPFFYTRLGVPDTIDGRFGMLVLHLFLLEHRLMREDPTHDVTERKSFCRFLSEAFFDDMDANLRELGVADTGVSHRIAKMGKSYHGSLQAYAAAIDDPERLRAALARNLYGTIENGDVEALARMADYVTALRAQLAATETSTLLAGQYVWPDPSL